MHAVLTYASTFKKFFYEFHVFHNAVVVGTVGHTAVVTAYHVKVFAATVFQDHEIVGRNAR